MKLGRTGDNRYVFAFDQHGLDLCDTSNGETKRLEIKRTLSVTVDSCLAERSTILVLLHFRSEREDGRLVVFQLVRIFPDGSRPLQQLGDWTQPLPVGFLSDFTVELYQLCQGQSPFLLVRLPHGNLLLAPHDDVTHAEVFWRKVKPASLLPLVRDLPCLHSVATVNLYVDSFSNSVRKTLGIRPTKVMEFSPPARINHGQACCISTVISDEIDVSAPAILRYQGHHFVYVPSLYKMVHLTDCRAAVLSSDGLRIFYRKNNLNFGVCNVSSFTGPSSSLVVKSARSVATNGPIPNKETLPSELVPLVCKRVPVRKLIFIGSRLLPLALSIRGLGPVYQEDSPFYLFAFK